MPVEIEARFAAADAAPLRALAATQSLGDAVLGPPRTFDEVDRYLDTTGSRLAAAHWACRLRTRGDEARISLKGPPAPAPGTHGWLHRRDEVEGPATPALDPAAWPDSPAREHLLELAGSEPLIERFRLRQRRTERAVLLNGRRRLGTLTLDQVRIEHGRPLGELFVVELELAEDGADEATDELERLAGVLAATGGLVPEPRSKLERAAALLDAGA